MWDVMRTFVAEMRARGPEGLGKMDAPSIYCVVSVRGGNQVW